MAYTREIWELAERELEKRRRENERIGAKRIADAEKKDARLEEIRVALSRTGFALARAVLQPNNIEQRLEALKQESLALQKERRERLKALGLPEDTYAPVYTCPACRDTGYIQTTRCGCLEKELAKAAFFRSRLGDALKDQSFDNFELRYYPDDSRERMRKMVDFCRDWAQNFDRQTKSLLFSGGTGLGKTHLSTAIAKTVLESGHNVLYETAPSIFLNFEKEKFGRAAAGSTDCYTDCDLLIIDDLGAEFTTPLAVSALFQIINSRTIAGKMTIISTNYEPEALGEKYDEKILSRLAGEFVYLPFRGSDIRKLRRK